MLKLETLIHGSPDSLEKTLMLGKIKGKWRRKWQKMRRLDNITDLMDMNLSSSRREWKTKEPGALQSMRLQRVRHNLVTKLQQHNS